jgi:hypothetical protein
MCYIPSVEWEIEVTLEFENWWDSLTESEQEDVRAVVLLLRHYGPALRFPFSSGIQSSKHAHMRELRIQHAGQPYRVLYAFDPRRTAILLIGGKKVGESGWYEQFVPLADRLYDEYFGRPEKGGPHRWLSLSSSWNRKCRWERVSGPTPRPSA